MQIAIGIALGVILLLGIGIVFMLLNIKKQIKAIKNDIAFLERDESDEEWNNLYTTLENYQHSLLGRIEEIDSNVEYISNEVFELREGLQEEIADAMDVLEDAREIQKTLTKKD